MAIHVIHSVVGSGEVVPLEADESRGLSPPSPNGQRTNGKPSQKIHPKIRDLHGMSMSHAFTFSDFILMRKLHGTKLSKIFVDK